MVSFSIENPNKHLIRYGLVLIAISLVAYILELARFAHDTLNVVLGVGVIVRILVLLWMPVAAQMVSRNTWFWTIFAFIVPSPAFIILGWIGYKETPQYRSVFSDLEAKFLNRKKELEDMIERQEFSANQLDYKLAQYKKELSAQAQQILSSEQDNAEEKFLDKKLVQEGYVTDTNSEVFVEFDNKCPACGISVGENVDTCPECGLKLK
jgi:hypothetical protein